MTAPINPYLHLSRITVKWSEDYDCDGGLGCRVRAEVLVSGAAGPTETSFDTFQLETSLWGILEPSDAYRQEVEGELLTELRLLLQRVGVNTTAFDQRQHVDHFGKPIVQPVGAFWVME